MSKKLTLSAALSIFAMAGVALFAPQAAADGGEALPGLFSASAAGQAMPDVGTLLPSLR